MSKHIDQADVRGLATMWAEIVRLQVARLEDAVDQFQQAVSDQETRAAFEEAGRPAAWRTEARKARRTLSQRDVATVAADKYFLLLATAQLAKCARLLPHDGLPTLQDANLLKLLRNLEEHWEDPQGGAATALRALIPNITPGRLQYSKQDIWFEGVSVISLLQWAEEIDQRVRNASTSGPPTP